VLLLLLRGGGRMFVHTISNLHLRARGFSFSTLGKRAGIINLINKTG